MPGTHVRHTPTPKRNIGGTVMSRSIQSAVYIARFDFGGNLNVVSVSSSSSCLPACSWIWVFSVCQLSTAFNARPESKWHTRIMGVEAQFVHEQYCAKAIRQARLVCIIELISSWVDLKGKLMLLYRMVCSVELFIHHHRWTVASCRVCALLCCALRCLSS